MSFTQNIKPKIIAHRGLSSKAPENTIAAIQLAIQANVDFVEFDIQLSKDNIPIVIHDTSFKRTTNATTDHNTKDLDIHEIKKFDAGSWFSKEFKDEKIPSLKNVLQLDRKLTGYMIEIKGDEEPPQKIVDAVLKDLEDLPSCQTTNIILGSFSHNIIEAFQSACKFPIMGIVETEEALSRFISMGIKHLAIWERLATKHLLERLESEQVSCWAFTVDCPNAARQLLSQGIDGIISNRADEIL